jgi:putative Ca2+/H+ antiporter (TMEM165/GDT1 family)
MPSLPLRPISADVSLAVLLTVFAAIVPAELPDKTFVATLVLSTRFRAFPVWLGASGAFVIQTVVAVAAGRAVALLPRQPVYAVTALLFAVGAVLLLRVKEQPEDEEREVEQELAGVAAVVSFRRAVGISFAILFAAEWGDLTQLLTAAFEAKYRDPLAVGIGALAALCAVGGVGAMSGRVLLRVIPALWVRRAAAVLFTALAIVTALEAAGVA